MPPWPHSPPLPAPLPLPPRTARSEHMKQVRVTPRQSERMERSDPPGNGSFDAFRRAIVATQDFDEGLRSELLGILDGLDAEKSQRAPASGSAHKDAATGIGSTHRVEDRSLAHERGRFKASVKAQMRSERFHSTRLEELAILSSRLATMTTTATT